MYYADVIAIILSGKDWDEVKDLDELDLDMQKCIYCWNTLSQF